MPKGRPVKTEIRQKIATIIKQTNIAYGYQIYKIYKDVFGHISLRNLYYNLKKGVELGEFIIMDIKREKGMFTWGEEAEHKYYSLGPYALFWKLTDSQKNKLDNLKTVEVNIDWPTQIKNHISKLKKDIEKFNSIKVRLKYEDKRKMKNQLKTRIEQLKDWLKQKIGKNPILKTEIENLYKLFDNSHTP